mgnify:CR=1 FL=1
MMLKGTELNAVRAYYTALTGDKQEMVRLLGKAQDCATDAINVINTKVTKQMAENNIFISKIIDVLIKKGYGDKIRFMPDPPTPPTERDKYFQKARSIAASYGSILSTAAITAAAKKMVG